MSGEAVDSMATPEPRTAVLHGQSVAWTELPGPGPLLLLVHGVGSSRASWDTVLPHLAGAGGQRRPRARGVRPAAGSVAPRCRAGAAPGRAPTGRVRGGGGERRPVDGGPAQRPDLGRGHHDPARTGRPGRAGGLS